MSKKNSRFIELLKEGLENVGTQTALAKLIRASESRIPEWMKGDRLPSPDTLINLGKLALERGWSDPFFFWALAGVDTHILRLMADKVQKKQYELAGETVPIPCFRETTDGREEAGPPVSLPVRFLPHPDLTVCLLVDERATAIVNSPQGLFIIDASVEGAEDLSALWGHVVALRFPGTAYLREGVYIGRLLLIDEAYNTRQPEAARSVGRLGPLGSGEEIVEYLFIGEHLEPEGMKGLPLDDRDARNRRMGEIHVRARGLRPEKGIRILGKVIGRLTGHLESK